MRAHQPLSSSSVQEMISGGCQFWRRRGKLRSRQSARRRKVSRRLRCFNCRRCLIRGGALRLGGLLPFSPRERGERGEHTRRDDGGNRPSGSTSRSGRKSPDGDDGGNRPVRKHKPVGKNSPVREDG